MNKSISYPLVKLLKEKGFEYLQTEDNDYELGRHSYFKHYKSGEIHPLSHYYFDTSPNSVQWTSLNINAPILADVVMWLYEKHKIWIMVNNWYEHVLDNDDNILDKTHLFAWFITGEAEERTFKTPTEAYEAAIEYALTKLI